MNNKLRSGLIVAAICCVVLAWSAPAQAGWGHFRRGYAAPYVSVAGFGYGYGYYSGWNAYGWGGVEYPGYNSRFGCAYGLGYRLNHHHLNYFGVGCATGCQTGCQTGCNTRYVWRPRCRVCGCATVRCGCSCCGGNEVIVREGDPLYDNSVVSPDSGPQTAPIAPTPALPGAPSNAAPVPAPAVPTAPAPSPVKQTSVDGSSAMLTVHVPATAVVYVNGVRTRSGGELRRFVSRNMLAGFDYKYEVRAVAQVAGKPVTQSKTIRVQAGEMANLAFDLSAASTETSLTLHVPSDARVYLGGRETAGRGPIRTFKTAKLPAGQSWTDYAVRVVLDRDGRQQVRHRVIDLAAGEQRELEFDFAIDKVASTR